MANNLSVQGPTRAPGAPPLIAEVKPRDHVDLRNLSFDERVEPIVDVIRIRQLMMFPLGALRRRRSIALSIFTVVLLATATAITILPRTYFVEAKILARRNMVMPALGNPRRTVPSESDAPTRLASEAVMSRENLLTIVQEAELMKALPLVISPLGKVRALITEQFKGPLREDEKLDMLVALLERRMWVAPPPEGNEGTVNIGIVWRDPESAVRIIEVAQKSFLDRRYASEVTLIRESIDILDRYVATAHQAIQKSMDDLRRTPGVRRNNPNVAALLRSRETPSLEGAARLTQLQGTLTDRRTALTALETSRAQQVQTAQSRLAELQSSLGPEHPAVQVAKQNLESVKTESADLQRLRDEVDDLSRSVLELGGAVAAQTNSVDPVLQRMAYEAIASGSRIDSLEDPTLTYAKSRLKIATANYEEMLDRLEGARIELETARAAFKYRYTVISPPQFPKRPISPNVPLLAVGGLIMAGFLALFVVTALDIVGGRIVEAWQADRLLGLPVLGEVPAK